MRRVHRSINPARCRRQTGARGRLPLLLEPGAARLQCPLPRNEPIPEVRRLERLHLLAAVKQPVGMGDDGEASRGWSPPRWRSEPRRLPGVANRPRPPRRYPAIRPVHGRRGGFYPGPSSRAAMVGPCSVRGGGGSRGRSWDGCPAEKRAIWMLPHFFLSHNPQHCCQFPRFLVGYCRWGRAGGILLFTFMMSELGTNISTII